MRPTLSWADLAGRRVGVWGLGVEGRATLARLATLVPVPAVVLVDDGPAVAAVSGGPGSTRVRSTADGGLEALAACAVVVKSPGISRYDPPCRSLVEAGVPVVGGLGLWLQAVDRDRVLCVTGTKGKSTTAAIAGHLLRRWGRRVLVGGNIGVPLWDPAVPADPDLWVVEVSSYQATDVAVSPPVVGVTSLHADHLNWHGDEATYERDKLSLCTQPGARLTVAAGDDRRLRDRRDLLGPEVRWVGPARGAWVDRLGLAGAHNLVNAEIARVALAAMGVTEADDESALDAAADGFEPLPSRMEHVATIDGVDFVDDGLSTNVLPTLAAVAAYPGRRVALLVGGHDRGIDYGPLASGLHDRTDDTLVIALPDNGPRIAAALAADPSPAVTVEAAGDLPDAVGRAFAWARPGGVVLLSPAAPSFGRFRDYRHRAEVFTAAVRRLG